MTYKLEFLKSAKKEWDKLDSNNKDQFKKKLIKRIIKPNVQKDRLSGMANCYKIKLRTSGYRLVYKIIEATLIVQVVAVGKRDKEKVYHLASNRVV
jgi:mRNA interferase RelE/StbE